MKKMGMALAALALAAGCGKGGDDLKNQMMGMMRASKDKLCACKDKACAEAAQMDMAKEMMAFTEKHKAAIEKLDLKSDKDGEAQAGKIMEEMQKCMEKFAAAEPPAPPPAAPTEPPAAPPPTEPAPAAPAP